MLAAARSRSAWVRCVPGIVTVQSEVVGAGVFGFLAVWRVLGRGGVVSWEDFRKGLVVGNLKVFWKSALTVPVNLLKCAPLSGQWGRSSVGRAPQWHCGGQEFESPRLHHFSPKAGATPTLQTPRVLQIPNSSNPETSGFRTLGSSNVSNPGSSEKFPPVSNLRSSIRTNRVGIRSCFRMKTAHDSVPGKPAS